MPTPSMTHDALIYNTDDEYLATLVPFIHGGLADDEAVIAAVPRANAGLLRDGLNGAADSVGFLDRDDFYQRPVATIAGWRRALDEALARGHRRVRVIGEVAFGTESRHAAWTRYESAINRVFADSPAWIICPYDSRVLPSDTVTDAARTHPSVHDPVRRDSDTYQPPEHLLHAVREPMPPVAGAPAIAIALADTASPARHAVRDLCARYGWSGTERVGDLLLVVTEIASNGIRHGRAPRHFRAWVLGRTVVCEVSDAGPGPADPLVGYRPPLDGALAGGRGLWLAGQLCDGLAIDTRHGHTRVRFAIGLDDQAGPDDRAHADDRAQLDDRAHVDERTGPDEQTGLIRSGARSAAR